MAAGDSHPAMVQAMRLSKRPRRWPPAMSEHIKPFNPEGEYFFREGCHIIEISNSGSDEAVSIARARVEPGVVTRWHSVLDTFERYVITRGKGEVEVGENAATEVNSGDVVLIPPGTRQRIRNTGTSDLEFLAICSPRFRIENYQEIDD